MSRLMAKNSMDVAGSITVMRCADGEMIKKL